MLRGPRPVSMDLRRAPINKSFNVPSTSLVESCFSGMAVYVAPRRCCTYASGRSGILTGVDFPGCGAVGSVVYLISGGMVNSAYSGGLSDTSPYASSRTLRCLWVFWTLRGTVPLVFTMFPHWVNRVLRTTSISALCGFPRVRKSSPSPSHSLPFGAVGSVVYL